MFKTLIMELNLFLYFIIAILLIEVSNFIMEKRLSGQSNYNFSIERSLIKVLRKTVLAIAAISLSYWIFFELL